MSVRTERSGAEWRVVVAFVCVLGSFVSTSSSVTAKVAAPTATLSIRKVGTGSGLVVSSPAGISCGETCSASFDLGTAVTLTASAPVGSRFSGWSGRVCRGTAFTCELVMSGGKNVTAIFDSGPLLPRPRTDFGPLFGSLEVRKFGNGSVVSSPAGISCGATCSALFTMGSEVRLTAIPDDGWWFAGWTDSACGITVTRICVYRNVVLGRATAIFTQRNIETGYSHSCVLSGSFACWGDNYNGQLGDGTTTNRLLPTSLSSGSFAGMSVVAISVGTQHSCGLNYNGDVICWGLNSLGQIGDGTTTTRLSPVVTRLPLDGIRTVAVSAGDTHSCALEATGTVRCWGNNQHGQLGNGTTTNSSLPVAVSGGVLAGARVVAISVGGNHSCAVIRGGRVACWGRNNLGQIGDGTLNQQLLPVHVSYGVMAGSRATRISAGQDHTCAVLNVGRVACWGRNHAGQLGDNTTLNRTVAVSPVGSVLAAARVVAVSAGQTHSCVLTSVGAVACWGENTNYQLGDGTSTNRTQPVLISGGVLAGARVTAISAGGTHSCALTSTSSVACWGTNNFGQVGDGTTIARQLPVAVPGFP